MRIAILSRSPRIYSTQRLLEAALERGHDAFILDHGKCYVEIEQNKPKIFFEGEQVKVDAIVPRIGASITTYGSAIVRQFEMQDVFTTSKSIAITRARNKLRSMQILSRAGVDIPKTIFARETTSASDIIKHLGGTPVIIKLVKGTHGSGVVLADTRQAAKSVMQAFFSQNLPFLAQDFIEESGGADIRVFIVGGRAVASMKRQGHADDFRSNLHAGGTATKIKLTQEEKRVAQKAAKAMGLSVAGVDIVQSKRGPLVIEVNASPGLKGIERATRRDIATKIIKYAEQNAKRKPSRDKIGA